MENKILRVWHKGLGDNLQFSTLPELFYELGYEVWLSDKTSCSSEIYDLVWGCNSYVKGISSEPANCGEIPGNEYQNTENDFIKNWEKINGLEPKNSYPIIYYKPKIIEEYNSSILLDINCMSRKDDYLLDVVDDYLMQYYDNQNAWMIASPNHRYNGFKCKFNDPAYMRYICPANIFEYCDMIYSCKKFVCLLSGGNALASALKRYKDIDVDCLIHKTPTFKLALERKHFIFPNINYVEI